MQTELAVSPREHEDTEGLLKRLTTQSKNLRALRDKRDKLRAELEETEQFIQTTAADIGKLTLQLADQNTEHANGNGKRK